MATKNQQIFHYAIGVIASCIFSVLTLNLASSYLSTCGISNIIVESIFGIIGFVCYLLIYLISYSKLKGRTSQPHLIALILLGVSFICIMLAIEAFMTPRHRGGMFNLRCF